MQAGDVLHYVMLDSTTAFGRPPRELRVWNGLYEELQEAGITTPIGRVKTNFGEIFTSLTEQRKIIVLKRGRLRRIFFGDGLKRTYTLPIFGQEDAWIREMEGRIAESESDRERKLVFA